MRGLDDERVRLGEIQTVSVASGWPLCLYTWVRVEGNASASSASRNHAPCVRSGGRRFQALIRAYTTVPNEIPGLNFRPGVNV